jgi:hypothetical protein
MKAVAEAAMCLANAEGGYVVVGVADNVAGPDAIMSLTIRALICPVSRTRPMILRSVSSGVRR